MLFKRRKTYFVLLALFLLAHVAVVLLPFGDIKGTALCLLPPFVAISLALVSKEVYSSLLFGTLSGAALMHADATLFNFLPQAIVTMVGGNGNKIGLLDVLSDTWNMGILVFLVQIGIFVELINNSGVRAAFSNFAARHVKSRRSAQLTTLLLGCIFFIDDYFNCLTVGTIMRPITDSQKVSRAKLAYLIDSTGAPVCMLMPISSWVAAVSGYIESENVNGIDLFFRQIPFNYYCILTILMVAIIAFLNFDFGTMFAHEYNAQIKNDIFSSEERPYAEVERSQNRAHGSFVDLIIPIVVLVSSTLTSIIYTGGFFSTALSFENFLNAFANADASRGLAISSVITISFTMCYLRFRKILSLDSLMRAIPNGIKHMAVPLSILVLAWVFGSVIRYGLGTNEFFATMLGSAENFKKFLPAMIFLVSVVLAFATGTSWGTISVLAPIAVAVFSFDANETLCVIALSAVCAGAVCGDHASPISDTSIMASTGAQCSLMDHIVTQLPYVLTVVVVSFFSFVLAGFVQNAFVCLFMSMVMMIAVLVAIKAVNSIWHFGHYAEIQEIKSQK